MISVIPLILNKDDSSFIERLNKYGVKDFIEQLTKELNAQRVDDAIIADAVDNSLELLNRELFYGPSIYLIFFDEHSQMKYFNSREFELLQWHISAIPVYCYLPSLGSIPFKIKVEEVHMLNSGRPFNLICLSEKWEKSLPELSKSLNELCEKGTFLLNKIYPDAQKNVFAPNGNLFRLPYLRIFREDYSISVFYACLEYILMLLHSFVLINASIIASSDTLHRVKQEFKKDLSVMKEKYSDGFLYELLIKSHEILRDSSITYNICIAPLPTNVVDGMNEIFQTLDINYKLTNKTWMGFFEAYIAIRNATKGHGVLYYIETDSNRILLESIVELTKLIAKSSFAFSFQSKDGFKDLDIINFIYYSRLDDFTKEWMKYNKLFIKMNDSKKMTSLYPNILYNPTYDFFLFAGLSQDKTKYYYKNYSTGLYIENTSFNGII